MTEPDIRKGMPPVKLPREEFERRYRSRFADPAFKPLQRELEAIIAAAWDAYSHSRKSPVTRRAGSGFADPGYEIAVDWLATREAMLQAQRRHDDANEMPRILIINGSSRSEHTCPGEMSRRPGAWSSLPSRFSSIWDLRSISSISRGQLPNSANKFIPASPVSRPRWRSVTGRAVAIQTIRSGRPTTG